MTAVALIRKLEKAIKKHGPRTKVTLDLKELERAVTHMDDGYSHWEANCFSVVTLPWAENDSFELEDGSERVRTVIVIS